MVAAEPGEPPGLGGCHPHCTQALRVRPWQSPADVPSWQSPEDREAPPSRKTQMPIFSSKSGPRPPGAKNRKCLSGWRQRWVGEG